MKVRHRIQKFQKPSGGKSVYWSSTRHASISKFDQELLEQKTCGVLVSNSADLMLGIGP